MTDKNKQKTELNESASTTSAITTKWDEPVESKMNEILNRKEFSYDVNGDALYKQYADKFKLGGRMAMMDTMGQAQAMTGGYGNSYAQSVGQQAYQGYMQQLNDVIPELYSLAYGMYNDEGDRLLNEYGLLLDAQNNEYTKAVDDRNYNYQLGRDAVEDKQWQDTFDYNKTQDKYANSLSDAQIAASLGDYSKYKALGYDVSNAGKTAVEYDDLTTTDIYKLYEISDSVKDPGVYDRNIEEYDKIYSLLETYEMQGANPDVLDALRAQLIPDGYMDYLQKKTSNLSLPGKQGTYVSNSYYGSGGGGGGEKLAQTHIDDIRRFF